MADVLDRLQAAARQRILFLPHAIRQMSHPDRMITPEEVERVVLGGEIIEDYLAIITAYRPDPELWSADFKRRL